MRREQARYQELRRSATLIQRTWRGYVARRVYAEKINSIIIVQTQVIRYIKYIRHINYLCKDC